MSIVSKTYSVITRAYYEDAYIPFFIEYYVKLGFSMIFIIKMDNKLFNVEEQYKKNVEIVYNGNNDEPDKVFDKYLHWIKSYEFDWTLNVDIDEFLCLKENSIDKFIQSITVPNNRPTCVQFRWGLIERVDNDYMSFEDTIKKYGVIKNCLVKSMGLTKFIQKIECHSMKMSNMVSYPHTTPTHANIDPAFDFLYTYDNFILHVHTRSINNLIIKSFVTNLSDKKSEIGKFINMLNTHNYAFDIDALKQNIGIKFQLPFLHLSGQKMEIAFNHGEKFNNDFCNKTMELDSIKQLCADRLINFDIYNAFLFLFIEKNRKEFTNYFKK